MQGIQQQPTLCDIHVDETIESPVLRLPVDDPTPPTEAGGATSAERTGRKRSFIRLLFRALDAWPS